MSDDITVQVCGGPCLKAPDGKHKFDGPVEYFDNGATSTCSFCGARAIDVMELP